MQKIEGKGIYLYGSVVEYVEILFEFTRGSLSEVDYLGKSGWATRGGAF